MFGGASRRQVLAEAGVPEELRADIAHAKERAFLGALDRNELLPVKGAERFLRVLNNLGCPAALVSNSETAAQWVESTGLAWAFQAVVDGTSGVAPKPSPEGFLLASRRLGVPASRCVAVEDSATGATGARAAGAFVVGVGRGLDEDAVDLWVHELEQIPLDRWVVPAGERGVG